MVGDIPKGPLISPKAIEAWFTLMAEMMRGTAEAQETFRSLAEASTTPPEMREWLARFRPSLTGGFDAEAFEESVEEWWRMMGVVPRSRYLELLERHELLRARLEKAEETIRKLQTMLGVKEHQEEEAHKVLNLWDSMLKETLKTQAEWMRTWTMAEATDEDNDKKDDEA